MAQAIAIRTPYDDIDVLLVNQTILDA